MEITTNKITELNQSQDVLGKCEIVKEIFLRASKTPQLNKYFNEDSLNGLFSNVIVCKTEEKYKENYIKGLNKNARNDLTEFDIPLAFTDSETNKIYIRPDTPIEVIVHELVHSISNKTKKETGIYGVMKEHYINNDDPIKKMEVDSLNEAITHYITQMLIPELKISDGYNYGADIIDKYAKMSIECGMDSNRILDSYFNGNSKSFESIISDFGSNWQKVVTSINISRFMIYFKDSKELLSTEEIDKILNYMSQVINIQNVNNLNDYNNTRKIYSNVELMKISEISNQNEESKQRGR